MNYIDKRSKIDKEITVFARPDAEYIFMINHLSQAFPPLFRMITFLKLGEATLFDEKEGPAIIIGDGLDSIIRPVLNNVETSEEQFALIHKHFSDSKTIYFKEYSRNQGEEYAAISRQTMASKGLLKDLNTFLTKMGYVLHGIKDDGSKRDLINNFVSLVCLKLPEEERKDKAMEIRLLKDRFRGICAYGALKRLNMPKRREKNHRSQPSYNEQVAIEALVNLSNRKRAVSKALHKDKDEPQEKAPLRNRS